MAAVFSVAVAVNLELPAAMPTLDVIDGFPLYEMEMAVPPLMAASIRAEPLVLPSGSLLDRLAAALTSLAFLDTLRLCLRYLHPAAEGLDGIRWQPQFLCDFLVALALGAKVLDCCFLFLSHGVLSLLMLKGQKPPILAE